MTTLALLQLIVAVGIYNVWLIRPNRATAWRGGTAQNLREEFAVYGLSPTTMKVVGAAKLFSATAILLGIWYAPLALLGATILSVLMLAAVFFHYKVSDPSLRALPAACMFALSIVVVVAHM